jgi:hypothetical protein
MEQNQLLNNPKLVIKKIDDLHGFESITGRSRKGFRTSVSDAVDKVYISLHSYGERTKGKETKALCISFGKNICGKARFMEGDFIEGLYNKDSKTWLFRRTNDSRVGYKLGWSGGNVKGSKNIMVVKITYRPEFMPALDVGVKELSSVTIDERGIFASMK